MKLGLHFLFILTSLFLSGCPAITSGPSDSTDNDPLKCAVNCRIPGDKKPGDSEPFLGMFKLRAAFQNPMPDSLPQVLTGKQLPDGQYIAVSDAEDKFIGNAVIKKRDKSNKVFVTELNGKSLVFAPMDDGNLPPTGATKIGETWVVLTVDNWYEEIGPVGTRGYAFLYEAGKSEKIEVTYSPSGNPTLPIKVTAIKNPENPIFPINVDGTSKDDVTILKTGKSCVGTRSLSCNEFDASYALPVDLKESFDQVD